jgi:hypothetical protein
MKLKTMALIPTVAIISAIWQPDLQASVITYTIGNAILTDDAAISGSFSVDTNTDVATANMDLSAPLFGSGNSAVFTGTSDLVQTSTYFSWFFYNFNETEAVELTYAGTYSDQPLLIDSFKNTFADNCACVNDVTTTIDTASAAPEPTTAALMLLAALGLAGRNRFRKYRQVKRSNPATALSR